VLNVPACGVVCCALVGAEPHRSTLEVVAEEPEKWDVEQAATSDESGAFLALAGFSGPMKGVRQG